MNQFPIKNLGGFIFLLFLASCGNKTEPVQKLPDCPYETIESFSENTIQTEGIKHNGEIGLAIESNLKKLAELNFEIRDHFTAYRDLIERKTFRGMNYSSNQVIEHNLKVSIICGVHEEWLLEKDPLMKTQFRTQLNRMVQDYFDFLMGLSKKVIAPQDEEEDPIPLPEKAIYKATIYLTVDYQYSNARIKVNGQFREISRQGNKLIIETQQAQGNCIVEVVPEHETPCQPISFMIQSDTTILKNYRCS